MWHLCQGQAESLDPSLLCGFSDQVLTAAGHWRSLTPTHCGPRWRAPPLTPEAAGAPPAQHRHRPRLGHDPPPPARVGCDECDLAVQYSTVTHLLVVILCDVVVARLKDLRHHLGAFVRPAIPDLQHWERRGPAGCHHDAASV